MTNELNEQYDENQDTVVWSHKETGKTWVVETEEMALSVKLETEDKDGVNWLHGVCVDGLQWRVKASSVA